MRIVETDIPQVIRRKPNHQRTNDEGRKERQRGHSRSRRLRRNDAPTSRKRKSIFRSVDLRGERRSWKSRVRLRVRVGLVVGPGRTGWNEEEEEGKGKRERVGWLSALPDPLPPYSTRLAKEFSLTTRKEAYTHSRR